MSLKSVTIRCSLFALSVTLPLSAFAFADPPKQIDIAAGDLSRALLQLSNEYGADLVYRPEQVYGVRTSGAHGSLTSEQAVTELLRGTRLRVTVAHTGALLIATPESNASGGGARSSSPNSGSPQSADGESKTGSFRVAQADQGVSAGALPVAGRDSGQSIQLQEVVVTAQKREQRLQDVPVPVTALNAQTLGDTNLSRLQDYYAQVPGFTVTPSVNGLTTLAIRGVTSGGLANPTVAVTVDEVPFGTSNITAGGLLVPDLDPSDLARIEVLRGPQGTLYGASSLGGLFKYVTVDPSTQGVSGRVQAGVSTVYSAGDAGYNTRGSINVPLSDSVAIRASAFHRLDPGYIDDVRTGQPDINKATADGGHLTLLFKPIESFSVKLGALLQRFKDDGSSDVDVPTPGYPQTNGLNGLQQPRLLGSGWLRDTAQLYSANIKYKMGGIELTSVTGYGVNSESNSLDYTYLVGPIMQSLFGVSGAPFLNHYYTTKLSEELRASMPLGERFDWLVGGFYTSERTHLSQNIAAANPSTAQIVGSWSLTDVILKYREYAAFTDLTVHLTEQLDVQLGARESHIDVPFGAATEVGKRFNGEIIVPANESTANAFTYLVTPEYRFSPDLMLYARLASGYRPGAPNTGAGVALGVVPSSYSPDKTHNYELGVKGDFLEHRVSVDASVYYIDWKNIQLTLLTTGSGTIAPQSYTGNAGAAKSEGVEFSTQVNPTDDLTFSGWISYDDAVLTAGFPKSSTVAGAAGAQLPTTARWSGNVSIEQRVPITGTLQGFAGGTYSYINQRRGPFLAGNAVRATFPSYSQLNLNTGLRYSGWSGTLFVNNVADQRGVLNGGAGYFPPFGYSYILPRTIGINVVKSF